MTRDHQGTRQRTISFSAAFVYTRRRWIGSAARLTSSQHLTTPRPRKTLSFMPRPFFPGGRKSVPNVVSRSYDSTRLFACAIEKKSYQGRDIVETSFEDLCKRFDIFLSQRKALGDPQRGMIILDKTTRETSLQKLSREFRKVGTQWGVLRKHCGYALLRGLTGLAACTGCGPCRVLCVSPLQFGRCAVLRSDRPSL